RSRGHGERDEREQPARSRRVALACRDAVARGLGGEHERSEREQAERAGREAREAALAAALPDAHRPRGEDQDDGGFDQEEHAMCTCTCTRTRKCTCTALTPRTPPPAFPPKFPRPGGGGTWGGRPGGWAG